MVLTFKQRLKLLLFNPLRRIYVVLHGKYKGEWLVVATEDKNGISFFSLPDKPIRVIPRKDFEWGLANKVLEAVDVLPKRVYNVCLAEYQLALSNVKRANTIDRWEQHAAPDILDSEQHGSEVDQLERD